MTKEQDKLVSEADMRTALKMAIEYLTNIQLDYKGHEVRKACKEALEQTAMTYEQGFAHGYEAHRVEQENNKQESIVSLWDALTDEQPAQEIGDAEIKQMLDDIEYYKNRLAKYEDVL